MNVLVINTGSSTLKFRVFQMAVESKAAGSPNKLAQGVVERIGHEASYRFEMPGQAPESRSIAVKDHEEAVRLVIRWLHANLQSRPIDAVGHRVVHGAAEFPGPAFIDDSVLAKIESLSELAPLHNPTALNVIRAARSVLGAQTPMVAAFDTSFHCTIPDAAAWYAIPYDLAVKYGIRRYGFHGLAHEYSMLRYGELANVAREEINVVTLHLGNGCSATAIRGGKSVETSMGFTPLEGLVMGTRSGDIDPAVVSYLARKEGVGAGEVENWLNQRSGLLGLSSLSGDMRELAGAYDRSARARLAIDVFCHRARKYLGAYLNLCGRPGAVVFSGGVGENSPLVRAKICADAGWCGLKLDKTLNEAALSDDTRISSDDALIQTYVVHTDEELLIAQETARIVGPSRWPPRDTN